MEFDITDVLLGINQQNVVIANGANLVINASRIVLASDLDPLVNIVNVHATIAGFPNVLDDSASASTDLFAPALTITKTGDAVSKVGDTISYVITVTNTSSPGTPNLVGTVVDPIAGINQPIDLATGGVVVINGTHVVVAVDPDPLVNTATVTVSPEGFPNVITASARWSTDLFKPSVTVDKTGDTQARVGDPVTYTITITNTSSAGTPNLILDSVTDTLLGTLTSNVPLAGTELTLGEVTSFDVTRTVLAGDPDPLLNTVTVHYHPDSFPNDVWDDDPHSVDIIHPSTIITVFSAVWETLPGGNLILTMSDKNDGDVPLTDSYVKLYSGYGTPSEVLIGTFDRSSPEFIGGDIGTPNVMDAGTPPPNGETWTWQVSLTISSDTTFTVIGGGNDPLGNEVTYPGDPEEIGAVFVEVGKATRTWGFWKTHLDFATYVFNTYVPSIDLGTWGVKPMLIDSMAEYMSVMYADQTKNSDGTPRFDIDQARVHTAQQALAAIINSYMPGSAPLPAGITLTSIRDTLSSNSIGQIRNLGGVLGGYNESGDDEALYPTLPPTGRADPKAAEALGASLPTFADTLPEPPKGKKP